MHLMIFQCSNFAAICRKCRGKVNDIPLKMKFNSGPGKNAAEKESIKSTNRSVKAKEEPNQEKQHSSGGGSGHQQKEYGDRRGGDDDDDDDDDSAGATEEG